MWQLAAELKKAFPPKLRDEIDAIINTTSASSLTNYPVRLSFNVAINDDEVLIPYRHNLGIVKHANIIKRLMPKDIALTDNQKNILSCFYTRHCDGYIREQNLKRIIHVEQEWAAPYVIQLIGEYVIEILQFIFENLSENNISIYKKFINDNPGFYKLTRQRVISYWDCYYRWRHKYQKDYVGFKILEILDS